MVCTVRYERDHNQRNRLCMCNIQIQVYADNGVKRSDYSDILSQMSVEMEMEGKINGRYENEKVKAVVTTWDLFKKR